MPRSARLVLLLGSIAIAGGCGGSERAPNDRAFVSMSAGETHLCALRGDGTASCVRVEGPETPPPNADGLPFPGFTPGERLELPSSFTGLRALAAGRDRTCGLTDDGAIVCHGHSPLAVAVAPSEVSDAVAIGLGSMHVAVVRPSRVVEVFDLRDGLLAVQTRRTADGHLEFDEQPVSADLGSRFGCAVDDDGNAYCWGGNSGGECGNGRDGLESEPVRVASAIAADSPDVSTAYEGCPDGCGSSLEEVRSVAARGATACALLESDGVACWGTSPGNAFLPDSNQPPVSRRPVMIAGSRGATAFCLGGAHVCVVLDGEVLCRGRITSSSELVDVPSLAGAIELACTEGAVCGRDRRGTIRCSGANGASNVRFD